MTNNSALNYNHHDTLLIKGFAIIAIVFHNYFHWLRHPIRENQFGFTADNFSNMIIAVSSNPQQLLHAFFSYFGHFGVVLFIFISAYGLAKSHKHINNFSTFINSRFKKIYPSLFIAIAMWLILYGRKQGITGPIYYLGEHIESISFVLLGVSNIIPGYTMKPVGPWWFIPFILQFYLIYPTLTRLAIKYNYAMPIIASAGILLNIIINPILIEKYDINLLFTPLGHLPEICLGIYSANYKFTMTFFVKVSALITFSLSNFYQTWWAFQNISALVLLLSAYEWIKKLCAKNYVIDQSLALFGRLSLGLFLINGFIRGAFVGTATNFNNPNIDIIFSLFNFTTCLFLAFMLEKIDIYRRRFI